MVAFDLGRDPRRLAQIMTPTSSDGHFVAGDITDLGALEGALADHDITNVIHLAALQVPFCRADPPLGARVNVDGHRQRVRGGPAPRSGRHGACRLHGLDRDVFATDVDPATGRLEEDADAHPGNHYGVYKLANEGTARLLGSTTAWRASASGR